MAENIFVQTDGVKHNYNGVKSIRTKNMDGGTTKWMPNEDTPLRTKNISKNGTYKAKNDNVYAYDKVVVKVTGKATGKKQDGNIYVVKPKGVDQELVETLVPSSINITTNPTKTSYNDGETIDVTGMVVKAYKGDGGLWTATGYSGGVIPNSELNIYPRVADYTGEGSSGQTKEVEIIWLRPEDEEELTDTFNITIAPLEPDEEEDED